MPTTSHRPSPIVPLLVVLACGLPAGTPARAASARADAARPMPVGVVWQHRALAPDDDPTMPLAMRIPTDDESAKPAPGEAPALPAPQPGVLVVDAGFAARQGIDSVPALVRYLQAHPGSVRFGTVGAAGSGRVAGDLFTWLTGTVAYPVTYPGAAAARLALRQGHVQFVMDDLASAAPWIRSGQLRALAVTSRARAAGFPGLPTLARSGVPALAGFDLGWGIGFGGPSRGGPGAWAPPSSTQNRASG